MKCKGINLTYFLTCEDRLRTSPGLLLMNLAKILIGFGILTATLAIFLETSFKLDDQNKILQEQNTLIRLQIEVEHPELKGEIKKIEEQFKVNNYR